MSPEGMLTCRLRKAVLRDQLEHPSLELTLRDAELTIVEQLDEPGDTSPVLQPMLPDVSTDDADGHEAFQEGTVQHLRECAVGKNGGKINDGTRRRRYAETPNNACARSR